MTLEYCLLAGVNDRPDDSAALAKVARALRGNVNLMMYNPVVICEVVEFLRTGAFDHDMDLLDAVEEFIPQVEEFIPQWR